MNDWIAFGDSTPLPVNYEALILALLLAFICGQLMAWIYKYTHTGLSYSRSFVSSLIVLPVTVALVMMVLNNNLVTAFGLLAVFAIVRFRNILRDTLNTVYILSVIVLGMACGSQKFTTALIGLLVTGSILIYIWYTNFGSRQRYDLILNLNWNRPVSEIREFEKFLKRHALKVKLASQSTFESDSGSQLSYRLLLRDPALSDLLIEEARSFEGTDAVSSLLADDESEA